MFFSPFLNAEEPFIFRKSAGIGLSFSYIPCKVFFYALKNPRSPFPQRAMKIPTLNICPMYSHPQVSYIVFFVLLSCYQT